ncbi:unnamed protein product [Spirodela intermedia]|uniref:Uncharacterized protein n=2 Tax=Spirodela intermedia TaxID=51605 RepID=A0A7I8IBX4_SPIIN|nr:unnamed protein product [Spirodela intermedia]CAA6654854.1 unnamed protein product [Spirodela intermedia]CAA7389549.1 unnamed protein product [Spirodela intermedia]
MVAPCALNHSAQSSTPPASLPSASSEEKPRTWATNATGTVLRLGAFLYNLKKRT